MANRRQELAAARQTIFAKAKDLKRWQDINVSDYQDRELVDAFKLLLEERHNKDTAKVWDLLRQAAQSTNESEAENARIEAAEIANNGIAKIQVKPAEMKNMDITATALFSKVNEEFEDEVAGFKVEIIESYSSRKISKPSLGERFRKSCTLF